MSVQIEMPQLSSEGESATLATWLVSTGEAVETGDVIAELETEKATVELEAPASGTIAELLVAAGTEDIVPGTVLGVIEAGVVEASAPESSAPDLAVAEATRSAPTTPVAPSVDPIPEPIPADDPAGTAAVAAPESEDTDSLRRSPTPLARRAAVRRGLDLDSVEGSGPRGRILEADVLGSEGSGGSATIAPGVADAADSAVAAGAASVGSVPALDLDAPHHEIRLSAMRRTIARRLTEAKQQIPHFYLRMRVSMDEVLRVRERLNEGLSGEAGETRISVNDFVVRAAALALRDVPEANVCFAEDRMLVFEDVDVSVAVATDGGLVTPVVREADRKGLTDLALELRELASRAREGRLAPSEYQGGTITISNLGMYGVETVYPILNPPQACILGVGAADELPVVRDGEVGVGRIAAFTLAADHRAVDGAVGARLLGALRERLEDPLSMML